MYTCTLNNMAERCTRSVSMECRCDLWCYRQLKPSIFPRVGHGSVFQNPTQPKISGHNPTHKSLHPTQPNPSLTLGMAYEVIPKTLYNNCYTSQTSSQSMTVIIQLQYSLADSGVFHNVKNITQSSLHPTQPNPPKIKKLWPNPTQPMDGPNPWPTLGHSAMFWVSSLPPSTVHVDTKFVNCHTVMN